MRRSERRNNLQICPRRDSNTGGSDLWSSTLPLDHGGAPVQFLEIDICGLSCSASACHPWCLARLCTSNRTVAPPAPTTSFAQTSMGHVQVTAPAATCCKDRIHCCPNGFLCDLVHLVCVQRKRAVAMVTTQRAVPVSDVTLCPDAAARCALNETCCGLASGEWGCCTLSQGVCCKDGAHCCPSGYQCNHKGTLCYKGDDTHPWTQLRQADVPPQQPKKQQQQQPHQQRQQQQQQENTSSSSASSHPAKALIKKKVICPGGKTFCDDGKTCCFKDKWHFNCCPFVNGVCCSDGAHCCPLGFMCDVKLDKCTKGGELTLPWGQTHESKKDEPEPEKQGPSFFKTLLSLLLDTFIDYEQDDDDDDDDDDEHDKSKRLRAFEAQKSSLGAHRETKPASATPKVSGIGKAAGKGTVSSRAKVAVSKAGMKSPPQTLNVRHGGTGGKAAKKAVLQGQPRVGGASGKRQPQKVIMKPDQMKKVLKFPPTSSVAGTRQQVPRSGVKATPKMTTIQGKVGVRNVQKPPSPNVVKKTGTQQAKISIGKTATQQAKLAAGKSSAQQAKVTAAKMAAQQRKLSTAKFSAQQGKSSVQQGKITAGKLTAQQVKVLTGKLAAQQTKRGTKPAAEIKKSMKPLAHPPPKMQVNIGVKRFLEPKTSTKIDEGKQKELPPITPRTKYKPKVKSVLKPISKPPMGPRQSAGGTKLGNLADKNIVKTDLKRPVIRKTVDTSKFGKNEEAMRQLADVQKRKMAAIDASIKPSGATSGTKSKPNSPSVANVPRKQLITTKIGTGGKLSSGNLKVKQGNKVLMSSSGAANLKAQQQKLKAMLHSGHVGKPSGINVKPGAGKVKPAVRPVAGKVKAAVKPGAGKVKPAVKPGAGKMKPAIKPGAGKVKPAVKPGAGKVKPAVKPGAGKMKPAVKPGAGKVKPAVKPVAGKVKPVVKPSAGKVKLAVKPGAGQMKPAVKPVAGKMKPAVKLGAGKMKPAIKPGAGKVKPPVKPGAGKVKPTIKLTAGKVNPAVRPGAGKAKPAVKPGAGTFGKKPVVKSGAATLKSNLKPDVSKKQTLKPGVAPKPHSKAGVSKKTAAIKPQAVKPAVIKTIAGSHSNVKPGSGMKPNEKFGKPAGIVKLGSKPSAVRAAANKPVAKSKNPSTKAKTVTKEAGKLPVVKSSMIHPIKPADKSKLQKAQMAKLKSSSLKQQKSKAVPPGMKKVQDLKFKKLTPGGATLQGVTVRVRANSEKRSPVLKVIGKPKLARKLWEAKRESGGWPAPRVDRVDSTSIQVYFMFLASQASTILTYTFLFQIHSLEGQSVICPDGTSECPDGSTCCIMLSGQYGCCPLKQAVCCKDHLHCCPQRTVCDQQHAICKASGLHSIQWIRTTGHVSGEQTENGQCADNKTKCPDDTTCCPMLDGYYACCPFKNAKCCSDKLHCCPSDEECDIEKGECIKRENEKSSMTPLSATPATSEDRVICPDHQSCQSGSTCCQISATIYGCCPFSNAVCCSDHTHCCPAGYTCDVTAGTCQSTGSSIPWLTKREAQPVAPSEMNKPIRSIDRNLPVGDNKVICPDHTSFCPDQTTCCMLQSGQYGCCPLPNAVCCADHQHCCPTGYKCDVKKSTCLKSEDKIPWQQTTQPQAVSVKATWVPCPDHRTQCPDGETCCILSSGQYGCCPIPNAVCCSDHLHCCPSGMICDPPYCRHASNSLTISWSLLNTRPSLANTALTQQQQQQQQQAEVTCRDHTFCAAESTCCIMTSGQYGCCPYPKATCCADKLHCCPEGFQCDKTGMRCEKSGSSIRLTSTLFTRFKPAPPRELTNDANKVKCPDGKKQCPEGSTCCKTPTGQYTCCPFVSAVCCKDGVHCCPQGYVCDPQSGSCTQAVPWLTKVPASSHVQHRSSSIICPDHEHQCPEYNTCCLLQGGEWGCCPLPMQLVDDYQSLTNQHSVGDEYKHVFDSLYNWHNQQRCRRREIKTRSDLFPRLASLRWPQYVAVTEYTVALLDTPVMWGEACVFIMVMGLYHSST
ncbi:hypothetical protein LSH36_47g04018 [Paralvinella palmiformis]|uniref:Granulins domain-containing protein n=1 Tax=Paralvinella palmiformis TaxID=53620 RepID=A0AAD9K630_9ANNE|nr:hypothetical protein LSH36_47g04018 [Paralvinella palmiformis]